MFVATSRVTISGSGSVFAKENDSAEYIEVTNGGHIVLPGYNVDEINVRQVLATDNITVDNPELSGFTFELTRARLPTSTHIRDSRTSVVAEGQ